MAPAEDSKVHWDYQHDIYSPSPLFLFPNDPTHALNPSSRDLSGHPFGMSSIRGSSALLHGENLDENSYDKYSASGYAPSLASWTFPNSDSPTTRLFTHSNKFGDNVDSLGLSGHVEVKLQPPSSKPAPQSTLTGDLPPSRPGKDYMDHDASGIYHHLSPDPSESLLSPLPISWPGNRLSLGTLPGDIYYMLSGAANGSKDAPVTVGDDDGDDGFSPDCPFSPLLWTSPGSDDTDLDDDSLVSPTSLSPPDYPDNELRHSPLESDEDEEFEDDHYYSQLSPPMHHDDHRYHIDQYPSHFDLYDEALSPLSLSSPHQRRLSPESQPTSPPSPISDSFGLPPLSFSNQPQWSLYNTDDVSTHVPCSPSRRRSADLPLLDEDPFGLQEGSSSSSSTSSSTNERQQRNFWLSLPGAETDDDLIPRELGSKNYVPDPTITVPTTPPSSSTGGLLLWDVDGGDDLVRRRSPSPEDFYLDPAFLAELPNDETGAEVQKLYELKQRTTGRESWEREKSRELSTLLRLKLKLDETGTIACSSNAKSNDANHSTLQEPGGATTSPPILAPATAASTALATSSASCPEAASSFIPYPAPDPPPLSTPKSASSSRSHQFRIPHHKPTISSMDQLVANMVFHRQQEPLRKKPVRARTWSPPAVGVPKSHPTPKSPLRQELLPEDCDEDEGLGQLVESPLPLSPLCLMEADLAPSSAVH